MMVDKMPKTPTDLERTEELFRFLQGDVPEGYQLQDHLVPRLNAEQAWIVIWYLGELHWQVTDQIEQCDVCKTLYDSRQEGDYSDDGPLNHFCRDCDHLCPSEEDEETDA